MYKLGLYLNPNTNLLDSNYEPDSWNPANPPVLNSYSAEYVPGNTITLFGSNFSIEKTSSLFYTTFADQTLGQIPNNLYSYNEVDSAPYLTSNEDMPPLGNKYIVSEAITKDIRPIQYQFSADVSEVFLEAWCRIERPLFVYPSIPYVAGTYNIGDAVTYVSGNTVKVRSTINGNTNDPRVDMTGWEVLDANQIKTFRCVDGTGESNAQGRPLGFTSLIEVDGSMHITDNGSTYNGYASPINDSDWNKVIIYLKMGDLNTANGKFYAKWGALTSLTGSSVNPGHLASPSGVISANDYNGDLITNRNGTNASLNLRRILLPYFQRTYQQSRIAVAGLTISTTQERVIIGDASTWAACDRKKCFTVKTTALDNESVSIECIDSHLNGKDLYAYKVNHDGKINANGLKIKSALALLKDENFLSGTLASKTWIENQSGNENYSAIVTTSDNKKALRHNVDTDRGSNDPISNKLPSGLYTHKFLCTNFYRSSTTKSIVFEQVHRFDDSWWHTQPNDAYPIIAGKLFLEDYTVGSNACYLGLTNNGQLTFIAGNESLPNTTWSHQLDGGWTNRAYGWKNSNGTARNSIVFNNSTRLFGSNGVWCKFTLEIIYNPNNIGYHKGRIRICDEIIFDSLAVNTDSNGWFNLPIEYEFKGTRFITSSVDLNSPQDSVTDPGTYTGIAGGLEVANYTLYSGLSEKPKHTTLSIVGTDFGTGPNVLLYADFTTLPTNSNAPLNCASIGLFDLDPDKGSRIPPIRTGWNNRNGIGIREGGTNASTNNRLTGFRLQYPEKTNFFASYEMCVPQGRYFSGATDFRSFPNASTIKPLWLFRGAPDSATEADIVLGSYSTPNFMFNGNQAAGTTYMADQANFDFTGWNSFSGYIIAGADPFVDNGEKWSVMTSSSGSEIDTVTNIPAFGGGATTAKYNYLQFPGWSGNGSQDYTQHLFSYVYFAVANDNSVKARVELINNATYANATIRRVIAARSWINTNVIIKASPGMLQGITHVALTRANGTQTIYTLASITV